MADVEYMHICDYAFAGEGGKPCIIGVFEFIQSNAFPASHPFMVIAVQLNGKAHEVIPLRIELGRPNGDVLVGMDGQVAVNEHGKAFMNFRLVNIIFPEAGRYTVKVSSGGQTLVSQSLRLLKQPASPPQGGGKPH